MESLTQSNVIEIYRFVAYHDERGIHVISLRGTANDHSLLCDVLFDNDFELFPIDFDRWNKLYNNQDDRMKCYSLTDMKALKEFIKFFSAKD